MNRNTLQREIVYNAVNTLTTHPTPDEIFEFINKKYPSISRSTVYRNLNILADNGDILKVMIPDGADRYDFNTTSHYHIVCDECGRVDDIEAKTNERLVDEVSDSFGYKVKGFTAVFFGTCPECNKKHQ